MVGGQLLIQLWTSGLFGTKSGYCVQTTSQSGPLTSSALLVLIQWLFPLKLREFSNAQQEDRQLWDGPRHLALCILPWTRFSFVLCESTHFLHERSIAFAAHKRRHESFCALMHLWRRVCQLSVLLWVTQVIYHNWLKRAALSLSRCSCEICVGLIGAHLEAGCFHQRHTETFSSGQGFTIIWMFSGFPVWPEEILQHPVCFQQPLDSEPSTFWGDLSACVMCWNEKSEYNLNLKCYLVFLVCYLFIKCNAALK